jgi:hypothetical protein
MQASDIGTAHEAVSAERAEPGIPTPRRAERPALLWLWGLAAGVAAGLIAWLAGEIAYGTFAPSDKLLHNLNPALSPALAQEQRAANINNATLAFGLLGTIVGLTLGVAGGLARRSLKSGVMAGVIGLLAGGAVGAGVARALVPISEDYSQLLSDNLGYSLLIHGGIWSAVAAAGGLAFGLGIAGRGTIPRAILGAIVGALLGAAVYEVAGALAAPMAETSRPLSITSATRLFARLTTTIPMALGAVWAVRLAGNHHTSSTKSVEDE